MKTANEAIDHVLNSKVGKELADPQRWREAMTATWARHPDPRIREFAKSWQEGASIRDLAKTHRGLIEDCLRAISRH